MSFPWMVRRALVETSGSQETKRGKRIAALAASRRPHLRLILAILVAIALPDNMRAQDDAVPSFDPGTADYDSIHSRVAALQSAGQSRDATQKLVEEWLRARDIGQIRIEQARWCLEQCLPQKADRKEFSVTWTGEITSSKPGPFVFSVSPINVNKNGIGETVKHTISAFVEGKQVLGAGPDKWEWRGNPIQLRAGRPVPLRVELSYSTSDGTYGDSPHALFYWEGPGISRQIVPTEALSPPDGKGHGLQGDYRWTENGRPRQAVLHDRNIEFAWVTCRDVAPSNPEIVEALTDRLWQACTNRSYFAEQTSDPPPDHSHVYFRNYTSTEFLSMARRREFVQMLLQSPELLRRADQTQILRLYHVLRFGDDEGALDLLGSWMQFHVDAAPEITQDFFDSNRRFYRTVALYLVFRAPDSGQYQRFQDRYLETNTGGCCLPVAYSLSYSYLMAGRIDDWVELLEAQLKDESLSGNQRVNWLIARAQAQEVRHASGYRYELPAGSVLSGKHWLTEAHLVADDDATRGRLYREEIARLATTNHAASTKEILSSAAGKVPAQVLNAWRQETEAASKAWQDRQAEDEKVAREAYVNIIEQRREQAAAQNDDEARSRYDGILQESGVGSQ